MWWYRWQLAWHVENFFITIFDALDFSIQKDNRKEHIDTIEGSKIKLTYGIKDRNQLCNLLINKKILSRIVKIDHNQVL